MATNVASISMALKIVRRRFILSLFGAGVEVKFIAIQLQCSTRTVHRWLARSCSDSECCDHRRSGRPRTYDEQATVRIIGFYCQTRPFPDCGRWSVRWAACAIRQDSNQLGLHPSKSTIQRILKNNSLRPHLSGYFLNITDPDFFPKMEHLLDLFFNPPAHLFFFDECPGIQVLKRLAPDLRSDTIEKRLEEFEYIRNGTLDVLAFLEHASGKVVLECQPDHTIDTFLQVFERHVNQFPEKQELHYVMDNLASHASYALCQLVARLSGVACPHERHLHRQADRRAWLSSQNKRIVVHFTPFHGSWLNLIEIWFGILGRKVLSESFSCPDELKQSIEAFVEQWNALFAHPFNWSYDGKGLHEKAVQRFVRMLDPSPEHFELRTLTKSMKLMANLLQDYHDQVSAEVWKSLATTMANQRDAILSFIREDDGPRRRIQGESALEHLMDALNRLPNAKQPEAA